METMNSRQRVIATLNRRPVDRVPIDLGSHPSTGISAFAYWNLREALGLPTDGTWIFDMVQMLAMVDEDIRQRFHVDVVTVEPAWPRVAGWNPRGPYEFTIPAAANPRKDGEGYWIVEDERGTMRMPPGGFFFDGDWLSHWDEVDEDTAIDLYAREAERLYEETPYALNYVGYTRGAAEGPSFFTNIDMAVRMLTDPDGVLAENELKCRRSIELAGKILDAMGGYIQVISIGNDMGMQSGPLCRPEHIERFCDFIHANSDVKVFIHNCGSVRPLIPIFIDCGIDILNPVQISADNMDPRELKAEFGDRIVFWGGGCDTQNVLGVKTPQEVAGHVRELMGIFAPGGGFVFNQVHNIQGDVPPENIVAMLDTAYAESFHPRGC